MPSLGKIAGGLLRAGTKTSVSGTKGLGKSVLEPLEKIARELPNNKGSIGWAKHVKKDKAAAYRIPDGVEGAIDVPGYVKIRKGSSSYLVKQSVADGYSKQTKMTRIS